MKSQSYTTRREAMLEKKQSKFFICFLLFILSATFFFPSLSKAQSIDGDFFFTASDGTTYDEYGSAVAVMPKMAIVGAVGENNRTGAAYVIALNDGVWSEQQKVSPDDGELGDLFGYAVAAHDDWIVVGAPAKNDSTGKVYIYKRAGNFITLQQAINANDGDIGHLFGSSVAVHDDVVVVGATGESTNGGEAGAVYVFEWNGDNWVETNKLLADDGITSDQFGCSVAIHEEVIAVGARFKEFYQMPLPVVPQAGAAYTFEKDGENWEQTATLVASDAADYDYFGHSIGVNVDGLGGVIKVIVGAYGVDEMGVNAGAAYYFTYDGVAWNESKFMPADIVAGDEFAYSVDMTNDIASAGAPNHNGGSGAAYILADDGVGNFVQMAKLTNPNAGSLDKGGYAVNVTNGIAIAGAYRNSTRATNAGAINFYELIAQPDNVTASEGTFESKVVVTWLDRSNFADGYHIYRDGVLLATTAPGTTIYEDFTVVLDEEYEYCIAAFNATWGESSLECAEGFRGEVDAPIDLIATFNENGLGLYEDRIKIDWNNISADADGIYVFKNDGVIDTLFPNQQNYLDTAVLSPFDYEYCLATFSFYQDTLIDATTAIITADAGNNVTDTVLLNTSIGDEALDNVLDSLIYPNDTLVYYLPWDSLFAAHGIAGMTNFALDTIDLLSGNFDTLGYFIDAATLVADTMISERELRSGNVCIDGRALIHSPTLDVVTYRGFEDRVLLQWTNNSMINQGYQIYRDGFLIGVVDNSAQNFYFDYDASSGQVHEYCVTAYKMVDFIVQSPVIETLTDIIVNAPGDTTFVQTDTSYMVTDTVAMVSESIRQDDINCGEGGVRMNSAFNILATKGDFETKIEVSWQDSSAVNDGFKLYKRGIEILQLPDVNGATLGTTFNYTDTDVLAGEVYWYCVKAYHAALGTSEEMCDSGYIEIRNPNYGECWSAPFADITDPCQAFTQAVNLPITHTQTVTQTINVSGLSSSIMDVNLTTFIPHANSSDLDISLTSPAGTTVNLVAAANVGNVANVFVGTIWDDAANAAVATYSFTDGVPVTHIAPEQALAAFNGEDPNGNWTLTITDNAASNDGSLKKWYLTICTPSSPIVDVITNSGAINNLGTGNELEGVCLLVEHANISHLQIKLIAPDGTSIFLSNQQGESITNFGDVLSNIELCFTPDAIHSLADYTGNRGGDYLPEQGFSAFNGVNPNGNWSLEVTDIVNFTEGILHSWRIRFTEGDCNRGLVASNGDFENQVTLTWSDESAVNDGYKIFRDGIEIKNIIDGNATTFTDSVNIESLTRYNYCVASYSNTFGDSPMACDIGWAELAAPTSVVATDGAFPTKVAISWIDNSVLNDDYHLYRDGVRIASFDDLTNAPGQLFTYEDFDASPFAIHQYCVEAISESLSLGLSQRICDDGSMVKPAIDNTGTATAGDFAVIEVLDRLPNIASNDNARLGYAVDVEDGEIIAGAPGISSLYAYNRGNNGSFVVSNICTIFPTGVTHNGGGSAGTIYNNGYALAVDQGKILSSATTFSSPLGALIDTRENGVAWGACDFVTLPSTPYQQDFVLPDNYGYAVAVDGNNAVAAIRDDSGNKTNFLIFNDDGNDWQVVNSFSVINDETHFNPNANQSVAMVGNLVLLGASERAIGGENGFVYLADDTNDDGSWENVGTLQVPAGSVDFGWAVAANEALAAVGDPSAGGGSVTIHSGYDNSFTPHPMFTLSPASLEPGDKFGWSVYVDGNNVLIGAPGDDDKGANAGAVYQYTFDGNNMLPVRKLVPGDGFAGIGFGTSVSIEDNLIAIGAPDHDIDGTNRGAVYSYISLNNNSVVASDGEFNNRVKIAWTFEPDDLIDEFVLYRDTIEIASLGAEAEVFYDHDALPGVVYNYKVTARQNNLLFEATDRGFVRANGKVTGTVSNSLSAGVPDVMVCADAPGVHHALQFDGTDDVVLSKTNLLLSFSDFTVEFWTKRNSAGNDDFAYTIGTGTDISYAGLANNDKFQVHISGQTIETDEVFSDTEWHHWAVTYDQSGGLVKIYQDAKLVKLAAGISSYTGNAPVFQLGTQNNTAFLNGYLDDFRVWNVLRSQDEIERDKNRILEGDEDGLVAYYHFNEGKGTVVGDYAKSGNHYGDLFGVSNLGPCWTYNVPKVNYCEFTDANGFYEILNVFYKESTEMIVEPSLQGHGFSPEKRFRELSNLNPTATGVDFVDTTGFIVSGTILTSTFNSLNGPVQCPVKDIEIWYKLETDTTFINSGISTAGDGTFELIIENPGAYNFEPRFSVTVESNDSTSLAQGGTPDTSNVSQTIANTHIFDPPTQSFFVDDHKPNVDFTDITTRQLAIRVLGACNADIGQAAVSISSVGGCLPLALETDGVSYFNTEPLPPLDYYLRVTDVRDNGQVNIGAINYFESRIEQADLKPGNDTIDFVFNRPFKVEISNYPSRATCPPTAAGYVLEQGESHAIALQIFQEFPDGSTCPADSGKLHITDNVSGEGNLILPFENGLAFYTFTPNEPNPIPPYMNSISIAAEVAGALTPVVGFDVLVTGVKPRDPTFVTFIDQIPLFILRDPPGDGSTSSLAVNGQMCNSTGFNSNTSLNVFTTFDPKIVFFGSSSNFEISLDLGFSVGSSLNINSCLTANQSFGTPDNPVLTGKAGDVYIGTGMNFIYALADRINYTGCEVVIDTSLAFQPDEITTDYVFTSYHIEETLLPNLKTIRGLQQSSGDNEGAFLTQSTIDTWEQVIKVNDNIKELLLGDDRRVATGDLQASLLPMNPEIREELEDIAVQDADGIVKLFDVQAEQLNGTIINFDDFDNAHFLATDFVLANDDLGSVLPWPEPQNHSFSAGTAVNQSVSVSQAWSNRLELGVSFDGSFTNTFKTDGSPSTFTGAGIGAFSGVITENGADFQASVGVKLAFAFGGVRENTRSVSTDISYTLTDDDLGDYLSVDVVGDPIWGTPVFKLRSGATSCPWEPGTARRDNPRMILGPGTTNILLNVPADEAAVFPVILQNINLDETREYAVRALNEYNIGGAGIELGSYGLINDNLSYYMAPGSQIENVIRISKGPIESNYDNLKVIMYPPCEFDLFTGNAGFSGAMQNVDTLTFTVHFISDCSGVEVFLPQDNWLINDVTGDDLAIVLTDYDTGAQGFQHIRLDYRPTSQQPATLPDGGWVNIDILDAAFLDALPDPYYTYNWNTAGLDDGGYEIKAVAVCQTPTGSETNTSLRIPGTIDRSTFLLVGTAEPADGILNAGENVSATFNSEIACSPFAFGANIFVTDLTTNTTLTYDSNADQLGEFKVICANNSDQIVLDIIDIESYEGHLFQVIIDTQNDPSNNIYPLTDWLDNPLYDPITWSFIVQQNAVFWNPPDLSYTIYEGDIHTASVQLSNVGTSAQAFQLDESALPDWIGISPVPSNNLSPNGFQDITLHFNLLNTLVGGNTYADVITANIDENPLVDSSGDGIPDNDADYMQLLPVSITVLSAPPIWNIDPTAFAYNMNMIAELNVNGDLSEDELDMISAYVDGELRGVANVEYFAPIDKYLAFMTIYNHNETGDSVTFRAWDASSGVMYGARRFSMTGDADISFVHQSTIGSLNIPETLFAGAENVQCIDLNTGWNLVSLNVEAQNMAVNTLLASLNAVTGDVVKTQAGDVSMYDDQVGGWVGTVTSLNNSEAFYIKLANSGQLCVTGTATDLTVENIPLLAGWNGISYPSQTSSTLDAALANLNAADGDLITHPYQNVFAQYNAGTDSWIGTLTHLEPNNGYVLNTANATTLIFAESNLLGWQYASEDYQYSMNVIGRIEIDAVPSFDTNDEVGAFINGEGRGYVQSLNVPELGQNVVMLTIFSNEANLNETIEFKVYDADADTVYTTVSTLNFNADQVTGTISDPYAFAVYTCGEVTLTTSDETCTNAYDGVAIADVGISCGTHGTPCLTNPDEFNIGNSTTGDEEISPFQSAWEDSRFQYLFTADELQAAGLHAGVLSEMAFNVLEKHSLQPFENFSIKMKCTSQTSLSTGSFAASLKTVYTGSVSTTTGWNTLVFDQTYDWDGTTNLIIEFCFDNNSYSFYNDKVATSPTNFTSAAGFYDDGGTGCFFPTSLYAYSERPDVKFGACTTTFLWNDGQTTPSAVGLTAGTYTVDVSLPNACFITASVVVNSFSDLTITPEAVTGTCGTYSQGVASVNPVGGLPPYTFEWNNGVTTQLNTGLDAGTYTVIVTDANGCAQTTDVTVSTLSNADCLVVADIRVFLEGPYVANHTMNIALNNNGLLPLSQPYHEAPWNYTGQESVAAMPANAVDWILLEVRDKNDMDVILGSKAGILLRTGYVQDVSGASGIAFDNLPPDDYYVVVRHRNHLAAMSATPLSLPSSTVYDFSQSGAQAMGAGQQAWLESGVYGLYAGDLNSDGVVTITDFNFYQSEASLVNDYYTADCNLNRAVTVSDFNLYQQNASIIGISQIRY